MPFCKTLFKNSKKLVSIFITFILVTKTSKKKDNIVLVKILYIYYSSGFWKNIAKIKTLINSNSKVNMIILAYVLKLDLRVRQMNIGA